MSSTICLSLVTSNARFEPVKIGGTTVQHASLANWDEVERLGLAIGDRIWVIKANDIIPKIIRVTREGNNRDAISSPKTCPFCDDNVSRRVNTGGEEGVVIECQNEACPKKSTGKIKRWINSLDIQGIGVSVLEAMVAQLDLADVSQLYTLRDDPERLAASIINAEKQIRLGEKRAASILESIDDTRDLSLAQFLGSLGVDRLGKRRVELMIGAAAGKLNTLEAWRSGALRDATLAEKAGVPNTNNAIQDGIDAMSDLIDALIDRGVKVQAFDEPLTETGSDEEMKSICITGKLLSGKRKSDYKDPLEAAGHRLVDKVTKGLDYLVIADPESQSSKAQKARKYGVALISEEELQGLT